MINHLLSLKPRITGIPALFFLTQIRSCVMTTLPLWLARCNALRPSPSPQVSLTCCRDPWASRRTTARRSSSAVALSSCWPSGRSVQGSDARKRRCSYFARIQRSRSSLMVKTETDTFKDWQLSNGCSMKCHIAARNEAVNRLFCFWFGRKFSFNTTTKQAFFAPKWSLNPPSSLK